MVFGKGTPELAAFYEAQYAIAPGAVECMNLMQASWQPFQDIYEWVMPDGFTVRIPIIQTCKQKIEVDEADHTTFQYQTDVICGTEEGISLAANICHSTDGYIAREVARKCPFDLLAIHKSHCGSKTF